MLGHTLDVRYSEYYKYDLIDRHSYLEVGTNKQVFYKRLAHTCRKHDSIFW